MSRPNNGKRQLALKRKSNKIVFFDIDGTLIIDNEKNRLREIKKAIAGIKNQKIIFGINTNRPWTEAKKIYNTLSLTGPAICESGSYYLLDSNHLEKYMPKSDGHLRDRVVSYLKNNSTFCCYKIMIGKNKDILSKRQIANLIFITSNRRYTASIYVRKSGNTIIRTTRQIFNLLKSEFPELRVEILPKNGKIIISSKEVDKISTLSFIIEKYFKSYDVFMISDEEDVKNKYSNINFCGLKESNKTYKDNCRYVSDRRGIDGVLEIINNYL